VVADEPLGRRIRNAKIQKVPYVLIVGDDDVAAGTVGLNTRANEEERDVPLPALIERLETDSATPA